MKYTVRSYVAVEIQVEAESAYWAEELASKQIHQALQPISDYDYLEDANIYGPDGEEIDRDAEFEDL
jgi:hypothetical protein